MTATNGTTDLDALDRTDLIGMIQRNEWQYELVSERLAELELAMDDEGWRRLGGEFETEFSRDALLRIVRRSRFAYLSNPLINHALEVQAHYVMGLGVDVSAPHAAINDVVRAFWEDAGNRSELTADAALFRAEIELAATGNLFLALFTDQRDGRVRVRSMPVEEVTEIITNPDDRRDVWFYRREWRASVDGRDVQRVALYPDWRHWPATRPDAISGVPVAWDAPVMHRAVGGIGRMRYGVPETYSALDWAVAVREDLERFATIRRAQAQFAARVTTAGGRRGVAASKARLATTAGSAPETNPPPIAGSTFIGAQGAAEYEPIRLAGAAPHPDDARRLGLMVSAGLGIPETILFGNADAGNLATARTLDRPTELRMRARQQLWRDTILDLLDYVIGWAVSAPKGALRTLGRVTMTPAGQREIVWRTDRKTGEPIDPTPVVTFPEILERDTKARVDALAVARTMLPESAQRTVARLVLAALDVDDIDAVLDELFPEDAQSPEDAGIDQPPVMPDADAMFVAALRDLQSVLETMRSDA